jgi:hypothetical protein
MRLSAVLCSSSLFCIAFLTGCTLHTTAPDSLAHGVALQGRVHGGQQPIAGAHIYLMAANTTGYGNAAVSLLDGTVTQLSDSVGAYVLTDAQGGFSITGDYSCSAISAGGWWRPWCGGESCLGADGGAGAVSVEQLEFSCG